LRQLRQITLEAYDHQDAPFEKVVEAVVRDRDLSRHPLFQVMFMLQNNESAGITEHMLGEGLSLHAEPVEGNSTKFDLSVALSASSAGLNIDITYSTDLFEAGTVSRMLSHYEQLLQAVVSNPASAIEKLEILGVVEKQLLLQGFNDTEIAYATEKTLVDVFEAQVARTPEQVAIVSGERILTYRELDEYANRLSHYLQTKYSVGPEVLVGISQERSEWQVISILGIMKAGAAYVPVDPSYPQERIRYILSDSDLRVLLDEAALSQ
ncbi:AMP-binding protein, partial [Chitinophaga sp. GbtcB8]|uniref:AMP-binding protein n=1 Tax=Chitinophaga sp. GbtcB8 TaxID=2824753 RepID=UPI001C31085F